MNTIKHIQSQVVGSEKGEPVFMKNFASKNEAELYQLKRNLARTDMERFQMLCRMIRIGKMLSQQSGPK